MSCCQCQLFVQETPLTSQKACGWAFSWDRKSLPRQIAMQNSSRWSSGGSCHSGCRFHHWSSLQSKVKKPVWKSGQRKFSRSLCNALLVLRRPILPLGLSCSLLQVKLVYLLPSTLRLTLLSSLALPSPLPLTHLCETKAYMLVGHMSSLLTPPALLRLRPAKAIPIAGLLQTALPPPAARILRAQNPPRLSQRAAQLLRLLSLHSLAILQAIAPRPPHIIQGQASECLMASLLNFSSPTAISDVSLLLRAAG